MEHEVVAKLAADLKAGNLPPAEPRDIDAAVRSIADALSRPDTPRQCPESFALWFELSGTRHWLKR